MPSILPHQIFNSNKPERENYLSYYDRESLEIVNKLFRRDFQAFDYQLIKHL
ncbi:hypothetical protein [Geminocystis sp. NIES-3709]|uniref:hypothetical protein n=1 Tax=Geminocystis sp. NIES-3709 TaxID=1617448 RepID=UPI0005FCBC95|nr:hypothetical protein [Geminocystis sp. NIES-3709]BAQ64664.1 hypothetical protein GM3709_1429 [Geminocystis sp. NIES-3709]